MHNACEMSSPETWTLSRETDIKTPNIKPEAIEWEFEFMNLKNT